jgi:hypothetical protein
MLMLPGRGVRAFTRRVVLRPLPSGAGAEAVKRGGQQAAGDDACAFDVPLRPKPDKPPLPPAPGFAGLILTLTSTADGLDVASIECAGERLSAVSRHGAEMKLARGLPDQPWRACWPDGRVRLHGRSIHKLAQWTVEENAAHGPRLARYKPYGLAPPAGHISKARRPCRCRPVEVHRASLGKL